MVRRDEVPVIDSTGDGLGIIRDNQELFEGERLKMLVSPQDLAKRVAEIAADITERYGSNPDGVVFVPIFNGAAGFWDGLSQSLPDALSGNMQRARLSSYFGAKSSGEVEVIEFPSSEDLVGLKVVVVEGVMDSGLTLSAAGELLEAAGVTQYGFAVLVDKTGARKVAEISDDKLEFLGYQADDPFLVGDGIDYNQRFRELPGLYEYMGPETEK